MATVTDKILAVEAPLDPLAQKKLVRALAVLVGKIDRHRKWKHLETNPLEAARRAQEADKRAKLRDRICDHLEKWGTRTSGPRPVR